MVCIGVESICSIMLVNLFTIYNIIYRYHNVFIYVQTCNSNFKGGVIIRIQLLLYVLYPKKIPLLAITSERHSSSYISYTKRKYEPVYLKKKKKNVFLYMLVYI